MNFLVKILRFLYIFGESGLLCGAREAVANGRTEENQRRLPLAAKQRKKVCRRIIRTLSDI